MLACARSTGALADAGSDMQLAAEGLHAAAQVTLERGASAH
jgi:hypothetical protein